MSHLNLPAHYNEKSLLTMILVLALRSSVQEDVQIKTNKKKHGVMDDILFISENI